MTTDIVLARNNQGFFDFDFSEAGDFNTSQSLETAVFVSLFSDARASESEIFIPEQRRGWIGDVATSVPERRFGSLLWLLEQRRLLQTTVNDAVDYARRALEWMVEDGLLRDIQISGAVSGGATIELQIGLTTTDGDTSNLYVQLWRATVS